jgi:nucleoside-diphosphate-sugar epimerase
MSTEKRTVAITGASGLIGAHLLPVLLAEGWHLRTLSRRRWENSTGIDRIQGDIRSPEAVCALVRGCSAVIHLAGVAHTSLRSQAEIDEAERINVGGTRNVLAAAQNAGVGRVLLASSALVYAGQKGTDLNEQSPTAADSHYARTKLLVEREGSETASVGRLDVIIFRPCLTYGPGVRGNLESLMRAVRGHYYFHIRGCSPVRSFLSVGNAAAAISHLLREGQTGKVYNIADRNAGDLVEFVNAVADLMQVSRPRSLPLSAIRAAIAATVPLQWMGFRSPINLESLRKLTESFTLNVNALAQSGFQWCDEGLATRKQMVVTYLRSRN